VTGVSRPTPGSRYVGPPLYAGQHFPDEPTYTVLHKNGAVTPPGPATPLGQGGSGKVYRVRYKKMRQHRAVKFLTMEALPEESQQVEADFERTFEDEKRYLSSVAHGNIVQLYDMGVFQGRDGVWPYLVTQYIEGAELLEELMRPDIDGRDCYRALRDVLDAVRYLHGQGIGHSDIKPENIRCRTHKPLGAVLLDLGAAQKFQGSGEARPSTSDDMGEEGDRIDKPTPGKWRFITTKEIAHPDIRIYCAKEVTQEDLNYIFPYHDIYCFGRLLDKVLSEDTVAQKFRAYLGYSGIKALELMIERLSGPPHDHYYANIKQLCRDWQKLTKGYLAPLAVPELSLAADFKYAFSTPVGRVVITDRLAPVAAHKLFLRLGDVPQLELLDLKFSGATHTRLQHSLTVFRNTRYYLAHLLNGPVFRMMTSQEDIEATLILGLLHDVGHYQLSHLFEDYSAEQRLPRKEQSSFLAALDFDIPSDDDLFHAVYTYEPIEGHGSRGNYHEVIQRAARESTESKRRVTTADPLQSSLAKTVEACFSPATADAISDIHAFTYKGATAVTEAHTVLGAVLSSPIDADKVSYLVEDADRTGVRFGKGIDFDGLLGALRAPAPVDLKGAQQPILAITTKGLAAAESVIMNRHLMYERVYWHPANRAAIAMAKYCITRLIEKGLLDLPLFIQETFFKSYSEALSKLFDQFERMRRRRDEINPLGLLLDAERRVYRPIHESMDLPVTKLSDIAAREKDLTATLASARPQWDVMLGEIVIDVPVKARGNAEGDCGGTVLVYVGNSYEHGRPLRDVSDLVEPFERTHATRSRLYRVFASRRLVHEAGSDYLEEFARAAMNP
jgi:HD superfamily phosphohydrolase